MSRGDNALAIDYWDGLVARDEVPQEDLEVIEQLQAYFAAPVPAAAHDRARQQLQACLGARQIVMAAPAKSSTRAPSFSPVRSDAAGRPHSRRLLFAAIAATVLLFLGAGTAYFSGNMQRTREGGGIIPAATGSDDSGWPVFRGNSSRDGVTTEPGPTAEPTALWNVRVGGSTKQSPAVANGVVYVGSSNHKLFALDAETGEQRWVFEGDSSLEMTPAVANGLVYIPSANGTLYALDANDGTLRWTFAHPLGAYATPAVAGQTLFAGSMDGVLYAIDGFTGDVIWTFETGQPFQRAVAELNGVVYAGNDDGHLYALDAANGAVIWTYDTGASPLGMPVATEKSIFLVLTGGGLIQVDAKTGAYVRTFENTSTGQFSPPAVTDALIIAGGGVNDPDMHAYDIASGEELGIINNPYGGAFLAAPAVAGNVVYGVEYMGHIVAADPVTREVLWSYTVKVQNGVGDIESGPVIAGGVLYVSTDIGMVYALK